MRVLLSGIIGAAVAVAAWLGIEQATQSNYGWVAVLVGVITGLSVRWASRAGVSGASLRGALAVVLTLAAIVLAPKAKVLWLQNHMPQAADIAKAQQPDKNADDAGEGDGKEAAAAEQQPDAKLMGQPVGMVGQPGITKKSLQSSFSEWDMLWMSLGGLAAYIFGKNDSARPTETVVVEEEIIDGEPNDNESNA